VLIIRTQRISAVNKKIPVWDLPTRLFHWTLVATFLFSWWSAENRYMEWHIRSGICVLALIVFRLIWGFVGSSTARFKNFVRTPAYVIRYALSPKESSHMPGHNPLGGYSVIAILLIFTVQVSTGLIAIDIDGLDSGPLSYMVTFEQGRTASEVHRFTFNFLLIASSIHVIAISFYFLGCGKNLVLPMIVGKAPVKDEATPPFAPGNRYWLAAALSISIALAWWLDAAPGG
jgi:cytochrome b